MSEQKVNIENLSIRLPGQYKDKAKDIGQNTANNLSVRLPQHIKTNPSDSLSLRINISNEVTPDQLSNLITEAILKGLV